MARIVLIVAPILALVCLPGCSCSSEPKPLTDEQQQQFEEELQKVEEQERMQLQ